MAQTSLTCGIVCCSHSGEKDTMVCQLRVSPLHFSYIKACCSQHYYGMTTRRITAKGLKLLFISITSKPKYLYHTRRNSHCALTITWKCDISDDENRNLPVLKLLGWYKIIWILLEIDTLSVKCAETAILRNVGESLVWLANSTFKPIFDWLDYTGIIFKTTWMRREKFSVRVKNIF